MGLSGDYLERYVTRVRNVEPYQVEAVSAKYISPRNTSFVVGDAAGIQQALEKSGTLKVEKAQ